MFDWEERKEELNNVVCQMCKDKIACSIRSGYCYKIIGIISQEKLMIEQAKKEAVKEFASRIEIHCSNGERTKESINKLLKEYNACPTCKGKGFAYDDELEVYETCPDCRGKGEIK